MLTLVIVSLVLNVVLGVGLFISTRKNLQLDDKYEEMAEQVEDSLDILNECYQRIAKVAEMPVTSDDPIIQQLVGDIKYAKHAVLLVANKIVTFDRTDDEDEEE